MNNIDLIRKIAWSFHHTTSKDWDDLFQEAALAYLESLRTYNPKKGKITTYAWWCITSRLTSYLRKERKHSDPLQDIGAMDWADDTSDLLDRLSPDAQKIATVVLHSPRKFCYRSRYVARCRLSRVMLRKGWSALRIQQGMKELKIALN